MPRMGMGEQSLNDFRRRGTLLVCCLRLRKRKLLVVSKLACCLSRGQERGWKTSFLPHSFSSSASTMLLPLEARHRFIIIIHQTAVAWAVLVIMMMDRW